MIRKPAVFKEEHLQKEFDQNGFVKLRLLSKNQVEQLHQFYLEHRHAHETVIEERKFHATNDTDNEDLIADADAFIKQVMMDAIDKHFIDYKTIAANYLIKQSAPESELGPHQDLRFVDEERFYSFNVWVATEPTSKHNGGLRFIKGSHLWGETIRPLPFYPWKYRDLVNELPIYFTDVTTEVGECVVLNHACIHGSYPNLSGKTRIAAIVAMIPKEAEIVHYFLPDGCAENEVEKYAMTLQDFITLKKGTRPEKAHLIEKFKYDFSPMTIRDFNKKAQLLNLDGPLMIKDRYEQFKKKLSALFGIA